VTEFSETPCCDDHGQGQADAPIVAGKRPIRRLLRAFVAWLQRLNPNVHRMNDYMLRDIGLVRENGTDRHTNSL
jgi:hypothetical protein